MEVSGKLTGIGLNLETRKQVLSFEIEGQGNAMAMWEKYRNAERLDLDVVKHRESRSLNANAYMWTLCEKIAQKLSSEKVVHTKEDIYRDAIKHIGVYYDDDIEPKKVDRRRTAWEMIGTGWITERVDFTQDGNREIIRFYYGSSRYNTAQMSKLIDNIVQDAKAMGIETRTPEEIEKMKALWAEYEQKNKRA